MPAPGLEIRNQKLHSALDAIKANNWDSVNQFLVAYYTSNEEKVKKSVTASLSHYDGRAYGPGLILDAWVDRVPSGKSREALNKAITKKAAEIMVKECDVAYHRKELRISSSNLEVAHLSSEQGLQKIKNLYFTLMPCFWILLYTLLTAQNDYEKWNHTEKQGKDEMAARVITTIISMILFSRNRATDAFQLIIGVFLASTGASRRAIEVFNHMGLSVGYLTVQRTLVTLTKDATKCAQDFVRKADRLWGVVYDNINFTLRQASQRIDAGTFQLNATTLAVFSLPKSFTQAAYKAALNVFERNRLASQRRLLKLESLYITKEQQESVKAAFKYAVGSILLQHTGLHKRTKHSKPVWKLVRKWKPVIRPIGNEKTEFFPLPALDQEEASVRGTIKVVETIYTKILKFTTDYIPSQLRILVGDWLTIRNLRLMKEERKDEFSSFSRMDWIQEASMPFHFQLNAMYMLVRTHLGFTGDNDTASLEHHRHLLRRGKLDPKKPEYNKAKELVMHSLQARLLDCARVVLKLKSTKELKDWIPSPQDFETVVDEIVKQYASTSAAHDALEAGDEVQAHSILFIRDALTFWEFCDAVREGDVGRMWIVYRLWVFMMRGAGCHNYGNEILEMIAQFTYVLPPLLRDIVERTWLVNRWGAPGRNIPTDLYLEHNNGFLKNMFAALGSCASMDHIQNKCSACVEFLRYMAHDVSNFYGVSDFHRGQTEVSVRSDIDALCTDIAVQRLHGEHIARNVLPATRKTNPNTKRKTKRPSTGVRDILTIGMQALSEKKLFDQWMARGSVYLRGEDIDGGNGNYDDTDELFTGTAFDDSQGTLAVDVALDEDMGSECPFANINVDSQIEE